MEKEKLLNLLKSEITDIDAIGMILSNYIDYGGSNGGMLSVKQFPKVAECLLEWWAQKENMENYFDMDMEWEGKMDFLSLKISIENWANDKDLIKPENDKGQMCKTAEELGEMIKATLKNDKEGIIDGIGDVLVTLIIFAAIKELDIVECLQSAWNEIKDRKGKTVNGVFTKEKEETE